MTNQTKQAEMFKAQAAAGLELREGFEAMVSLLDEGQVKQEMMAMLDVHRAACTAARKQGDGFDKWSQNPMT